MAVRVSKTDFEEKVLKEKLPVLVDFYSDSCVACKKLAPVLGNAEDDYEDKIKVYKVNTNFDVELAEQYEVQANPTLILFKDGQAKDRKTGALKQVELNLWKSTVYTVQILWCLRLIKRKETTVLSAWKHILKKYSRE